ncbi:MAG: YfbR-like 5'-deoxynucleotidase [Candidatus Nealsonbacteria bacterium]
MKKSGIFYWKNREEDLKKIKRYHTKEVMFYRTNDLIHSKRVTAMVKEVLPFVKTLYPDLNQEKAKLIAKHHDDHEIVDGDTSLQYKLFMRENGDKDGLSKLQEKEMMAIEMISKFYPKKVQGYFFKQIALHAVFKDCIEAQLVSFCDKVDAYCEAIHETLAGNPIFMEPMLNYPIKTFNNLTGNFPLIKKVFSSNHNFFKFSVVCLDEYFQSGRIGAYPHTPQSIKRKVGIYHYEEWKRITLKNFGIYPLINKVEFHK